MQGLLGMRAQNNSHGGGGQHGDEYTFTLGYRQEGRLEQIEVVGQPLVGQPVAGR
jgi:hypothetical protein